MYVVLLRGRKTTPNSTEVRPNSTTLPSRILRPNNSAKSLPSSSIRSAYLNRLMFLADDLARRPTDVGLDITLARESATRCQVV